MVLKLILILATTLWASFYILGGMLAALEYIAMYPIQSAQFGMRATQEIVMGMGGAILVLAWFYFGVHKVVSGNGNY